ncbi:MULTISPECIES: LysR substrate-binding domain-containing protein [Pseudomonas]|uniref:LysR family transcriptional regulator n=3 Tax=Pseudomonas TaxID=286 RepID=A0A9Q6YCR7_PSEFR|nr:LysR substrate-binding domain-containing protein [Pseudomonas fragi]QPL29891.1 LysR family transcriptional regulator [Pseudomonas fragi]
MNRYAKNLPPLATLITFEAVGRNGSFTRAASELCLTQSAVSKQIRALEDHLKLALFERQARGIGLTLAGASLFSEVSTLLERLQHSVNRIKAAHAPNAVTVLCTHAVAQFWLFPRLLAFNTEHPSITVNIHASNDIDESSVADYDFCILYGAGQWSSLSAEPLFAEKVYPVARPDLVLSSINQPADLQGLPLIELDASGWNCMDWRDWFNHFGLEHKADAQRPTFNQVTLAYQAIVQGMGVGLGWDFMVRDKIERGELCRVGAFEFLSTNADHLAHSRQKTLSDAAMTFQRWLLDQARRDFSPTCP